MFGQLKRKILRRARGRGDHVYIAYVIGPRLAIFAAAVVALFWLPLQENMPQWLALTVRGLGALLMWTKAHSAYLSARKRLLIAEATRRRSERGQRM